MSRITALYIYPIKSCAGVRLQDSKLGLLGLAHDRRFMFVDAETRHMVTQREEPTMAKIVATVNASAQRLVLSTPHGTANTWLAPEDEDGGRTAPKTVPVTVWEDTVPGELVPGEPSELVSAWLSRNVILVRMPPAMDRVVDQTYAQPEDRVSFADGFPVLVANEASLGELNSRLEKPLGMERFRPNVVVDGLPAFAEEELGSLSLGAEARIDLVKPCARCVITTIDPATAERGKEPLATLATYRSRRDAKGKMQTYFAMNALVRSRGTVRVGDSVAFARDN